MGRLQTALQETTEAFRLGMEGLASERLTQLIDLWSADLKSFPEETLMQLNSHFNELFAAQSRKDFLYVADLLQYEITPLLALSSDK